MVDNSLPGCVDGLKLLKPNKRLEKIGEDRRESRSCEGRMKDMVTCSRWYRDTCTEC